MPTHGEGWAAGNLSLFRIIPVWKTGLNVSFCWGIGPSVRLVSSLRRIPFIASLRRGEAGRGVYNLSIDFNYYSGGMTIKISNKAINYLLFPKS
jgi:hypothetical protein